MPALSVEGVPDRRRRVALAGPSWWTLFAGLRHPVRFFRALVRRIQDDQILTLAAAMSYYFFFAFFPFLLFVLALVSLMPLQGLEEWILSTAAQVVPGEAYGMIERVVRGILDQPHSGLVSLGAALALWSSSSAVVSLMDALNRAYRVPETRPWWRVRLEALALTLGLSVFMIAAFVLTVFGGQLANLVSDVLGPVGLTIVQVARWVIGIALVYLVVAVLYHACPDVEQPWKWVTPGSIVFTLGFGASSAGFSYYVGQFGSYDKTYGSLGAVIILLLWMYILAFFLLLGGEVNALLEHMSPAGKAEGEKAEPQPRVPDARADEAQRAREVGSGS